MAPKRRVSGTVGVVAMDTARFTDFGVSLARMKLPKDWEVMGAYNYDCAHGCNFLADNFKGDRLMLLGDDHVMPAEMLTKLLEYDVDMVAPLCLSRRPPFEPVARINHEPVGFDQPPGLREVDVTGTAGMVIKREVFEALEAPYFQNVYENDRLLTDDIFFCRKARKAGFKVYVDTSLPLVHTALVHIAPEYDNGTWFRALDVGGFRVRFQDTD